MADNVFLAQVDDADALKIAEPVDGVVEVAMRV